MAGTVASLADGCLARSTRSGGATEKITWRNRSKGTVMIYVDTYVKPASRQLDGAYRLEVEKP